MATQTLTLALLAGALGLAAFALLRATLFRVEQGTIAVVQRLGRFLCEAGPGLHAKAPFVDRVAGRVDLRVQRLDVKVETKTADDAFVRVGLAVQYYVAPTQVCAAFYRFGDAAGQLASLATDALRARVPRLALRELFEREGELAGLVQAELARAAPCFGHEVFKVLVTDVEPDAQSREALGAADLARSRRREAAEKAEAARASSALAAEADAEGKARRSLAAVEHRRAAVESLRDAVGELRRVLPGVPTRDVMNFVLMAQYYESFKDLRAGSAAGLLLAPPSPDDVAGLTERLRNALFVETTRVARASGAPPAALPEGRAAASPVYSPWPALPGGPLPASPGGPLGAPPGGPLGAPPQSIWRAPPRPPLVAPPQSIEQAPPRIPLPASPEITVPAPGFRTASPSDTFRAAPRTAPPAAPESTGRAPADVAVPTPSGNGHAAPQATWPGYFEDNEAPRETSGEDPLGAWEAEGGSVGEPRPGASGRANAPNRPALPSGHTTQSAWAFRDRVGQFFYEFHRVYGPSQELDQGLSYWVMTRPGLAAGGAASERRSGQWMNYAFARRLRGDEMTFEHFSSLALMRDELPGLLLPRRTAEARP